MVTMRFEGGKELAAALDSLSTRVSKRIQREALRDAAEPIRKAMEARAPRGDPAPPNLKDTMTISNARGQDPRETAMAVGASKKGFYGSFLEFGTAHHQSKPWARPAFDEKNEAALAILARELWTALASRGISRSVSRNTPVIAGPGGFGGVGGNSGSLT